MRERSGLDKLARKMRRERLERRVLLAGVGGVVAGSFLSRPATAGDLDPAPGPPAPTGITLSDLSEKIAPGVRGRAEARRAVESYPDPTGVAHYRITESGSYVVTENLNASPGMDGILVEASNVQIDLNGHTLSGLTVQGGAETAAIRCATSMVTVSDGTLQGFTRGMEFSGASRFVIEDVDCFGALLAGFVLGSDGECYDCNAHQVTGGAGFILVPARTVVDACSALGCATGFDMTGSQLEVSDCNAYGCGTGYHLGGLRNDVSECAAWQCVTGFEVSSSFCEFYDCNVYQAASTAFVFSGSNNIVDECGAWQSPMGFSALGSGNLFVCNCTCQCAVGYDMGVGNNYGPWVTASGDLASNTDSKHPLVNLVFSPPVP